MKHMGLSGSYEPSPNPSPRQQQPMVGQDAYTVGMNNWFIASFNARMVEHTARIDSLYDATKQNVVNISKKFGDVRKAFGTVGKDHVRAFDEIYDHVSALTLEHDKRITELLEVVQVLAVDNQFLSGRIKQIKQEFVHFKGFKKVKQDDTQDEDEFMEECISNLEDQGVDDAEAACQVLWDEQQRTGIKQMPAQTKTVHRTHPDTTEDEQTQRLAQTVGIIDEVLAQ